MFSAYVCVGQHSSARASRSPRLSAYVSLLQHTSAYVAYVRRRPSAYVSIRQRSSDVSMRQHTSAYVSICQHTSVSMRQHTSAYVSMRSTRLPHPAHACQRLPPSSRLPRSAVPPTLPPLPPPPLAACSIPQHVSAYVRIRQHTSSHVAYVMTRCRLVFRRLRSLPAACVSIRQHTSHTIAYAAAFSSAASARCLTSCTAFT